MDALVLSQMIQIEDHHWWYLARRQIVEAALARTGLEAAEILDVGCGGGGNTAMLARFGRVRGVEMDPDARGVARSRGLCPVEDGRLPDDIPYGDDAFDLITLLDVLEHVPEDAAAVRTLAARLKAGGRLVVTVPAYRFLWRKQDDLNQHKRRYVRAELIAALRASGLRVEHATYYNFLLFPLLVGFILAHKLFGLEQASDNKLPAAPLNWMLWKILAAERWFVPFVRLPWGGSLLLVARRE